MVKISNRLIAVFVIGFILFQSYSIVSALILNFKMESEKRGIMFSGEPITARAVSGGVVTVGITAACSINLVKDWNFISLCADSADKSITHILNSLSGNYEYVLEWDNNVQQFKVYSIYSSSKPFTSFNENSSYFIFLKNSDSNLNIAGEEFEDMNISLGYQWDTPSYPYQFTGNITKYLETIPKQYQYVLKWDTVSQQYKIWSAASSNKPFRTIDMGEGQFIFITNTSGTVLRYNKSYLQS